MEFLRSKDLVAITFFLSILYAIKLVIDARVRGKLIATASEEFYRSILQNEEAARHRATLRWGIILTALAAGCALIALLGWNEISPRTIAVLLCATGLGNLGAYTAMRRA